MAYKIMIDAGHGGPDNGARYQNRLEKDDNLAMALAVGNILEQYGFWVEYTRKTDVYESPYEKAQKGNKGRVDLFVSIHRNSSPMPNQYNGVETLIYENDSFAEKVAENINRQMEWVGYRKIRVMKRPDLIVLNSTTMPAVLIEVGFINSDVDNTLFDTLFYESAFAIADGITSSIYPENYVWS